MRVVSYKKIILFIFILLFSFLISLVFTKLVSAPDGSVLINGQWELTTNKNIFITNLPNKFLFKFRNYKKSISTTSESLNKNLKPGVYKISTKFNITENLNNMSLILPQQPTNGFSVYIDDKFIVEVGDLENGNGNTWKGNGIFKIPYPLHSGTHELVLNLFGIDRLTLNSSPYIDNPKLNPLKYSLITIINKNIGFFMMGITTIMGLLFLSLTIINKNENLNQTILGFSFLLWTIFLLDYTPLDYTIISYLNFKKLVSLSFTIGFLLNFTVIYRILNNNISKPMILSFFGLSIIVLLLIILPRDLSSFRIFSRIARIIYFSLFIPVILYPRVLYSNDRSINLISVGIIGSAFFAIRYLIFDTLNIPFLALRHIGTYFYLTFVFIYFIIDYFNRNRRILEESLRADHYYNKSVIDPLTNINNRNVLHYINFPEQKFTLFICDLDDFKNINDTFGHEVGDNVLIKVASIIKETIRESDYAIRIGGDEFVFILINCPYDKAKMIGDSIWAKISSSIIDTGDNKITFKCSGGGAISNPGEDYKGVLKRADKNLYDVKEGSKGTFKLS